MSDTSETFDVNNIQVGVWMGGDKEGNSAHGLYSDIHWGLFDIDDMGRDVILGSDGGPLPFGPYEGVRLLSKDELPYAVKAADEAADIGDPLYVDLVVVSELTGKTWFLRDVIGALSTSFW